MRSTSVITQAELGKRIRHARERASMTQEALARAVGRDPKAIIEYEQGKRKLSAADLPIYAEVLGVEISYFFDGELPTNQLDQILLQAFHMLKTEDDKHAAIQSVRLISDVANRRYSPE